MAERILKTEKLRCMSALLRDGGDRVAIGIYGNVPPDSYRQASSYIDQILRGAKPEGGLARAGHHGWTWRRLSRRVVEAGHVLIKEAKGLGK